MGWELFDIVNVELKEEELKRSLLSRGDRE
jgi:hypothetical protein